MILPAKVPIVRLCVLLVSILPALFFTHLAHVTKHNCIKKVFNRYCLGATKSRLPASAAQIDTTGEITRYRINDESKYLALSLQNERVTAVVRHEPPGDWLNFTHFKTKLIRLYGQGDDLSELPDYATSRSSRLNAINAGKGFAYMRWRQPQWPVSLIWNHRDYIILCYTLNTPAAKSINSEGL